MTDFEQSCAQLFHITGIPLAIADGQGLYRFSLPELSEGAVSPKIVQYVLWDFALQKRDALHPLISYVEPGYFVGVLALPGQQYCIVGLVSPFPHTRQEVLEICAQAVAPDSLQSFCDAMMRMPLVNLYQLKDLFRLLVRLAHGVDIPPENILFSDNTAHNLYGDRQLGSALFESRESADFHVPVDYETGVCDAIAAGDQTLLAYRLRQPQQGKIGRMSQNELQQHRYSFISFATLLSRAAIRGGLPAETAFNLSDVYCQRMDAQTEIAAVQQLTYSMAMDFCARVAEARGSGAHSEVIRRCIAYISAHLHEDIRLEALARECGLCGRSLSLRFRQETGLPIPDYIHHEKIREAKYLLEHTDYSLAQITVFLNYSTQSYFTQIFKKYEGCTPQQYRDSGGLR